MYQNYIYQMILEVKNGYNKENTFKKWLDQKCLRFLRKLLP